MNDKVEYHSGDPEEVFDKVEVLGEGYALFCILCSFLLDPTAKCTSA